MEEMKGTAPAETVGCTIDGGQEAKREIPAQVEGGHPALPSAAHSDHAAAPLVINMKQIVWSFVHVRISLPFVCLLFGLPAGAGAQTAPSPTTVGVVDIQGAIARTKEGRKAAAQLQIRWDPKSTDLRKKQSEISALTEQLKQSSNTMSEEDKKKLVQEIEQRTKILNRDTEDARTDFQQDSDKLLSEFGQRMMVVIDKYARDNGYAVILDISSQFNSQQTPVVYYAPADITDAIVLLYDKNTAATAPAASGAEGDARVAPKPAAPARK